MLDWKSKGLDLQEARIAEQPVDVDTYGVCGQLGMQSSA